MISSQTTWSVVKDSNTSSSVFDPITAFDKLIATISGSTVFGFWAVHRLGCLLRLEWVHLSLPPHCQYHHSKQLCREFRLRLSSWLCCFLNFGGNFNGRGVNLKWLSSLTGANPKSSLSSMSDGKLSSKALLSHGSFFTATYFLGVANLVVAVAFAVSELSPGTFSSSIVNSKHTILVSLSAHLNELYSPKTN